ncbi:MAG TPA: phosphotransferase family protein [Steroidobacteraceae bacterium]|jgi:aminoglycoside phosphotransferase (APT) family kinase protein|nr:phosphotransferase family protein [Steroidobacteraceae bacterium]
MNSATEGEDAVRAALAALAPRIDPAARDISGLKRLSGGATQEIWRFDLDTTEGYRPLILRRSRGGSHRSGMGVGLDVEAQLIAAARACGVSAPEVLHVLTPEDGLGSGFIMEFVAGETLGARIVKQPSLAGARATLAHSCGQILARIHAIDISQFPTLARQTPADLIEQWRAAYGRDIVRRPVFDLAFHELSASCPPPPRNARLVHGDFRNGNLMIGPEGVRAVLDWELAHIGDPMEDLGWLCVNSWRFGRIEKPVGGFGEYADLYAGYEAAGGPPVNRAMARWWEMFGTLRWGVMCTGSLAAFRSVDASVERAMIARRTSETEIDLLRLMAN